ncbi:MAG: hypothetical protein SGI71_07110 [Verrucomicrobiota bacterium]|nr:hypothetical protein [Verrucomicrobiota bacterium]
MLKSTPTPEPEQANAAPTDYPCNVCVGKGSGKCQAHGCVEGKLECTDPCIKPNKGKWEHLEVAGHDPKELWQKFYNKGSTTLYRGWNQGHYGELINYDASGAPVNAGKRPKCSGSMKVACQACEGKGERDNAGFVKALAKFLHVNLQVKLPDQA